MSADTVDVLIFVPLITTISPHSIPCDSIDPNYGRTTTHWVPRKATPSLGSSLGGVAFGSVHSALCTCCSRIFTVGTKADCRSRNRRSFYFAAWLSMDTGEVLSARDWPQTQRRFVRAHSATRRLDFSACDTRCGTLHWVLPRDGRVGDISSSDVLLRLSRASCVGKGQRVQA